MSGTRRDAEATGLEARRAALARLGAVLADGRIPGSAGAEAQRLADVVFRRLGQIDAVLGRFVDRMPPSPGREILRLLAGELLFAGTAPHAAVDVAVRLAKADRRTARLSGLINAVGRRIAAAEAPLPGDEANMPAWLARSLKADWGREAARAMGAAHLEGASHDICLKVPGDREVLARELDATLLPGHGLRLRPAAAERAAGFCRGSVVGAGRRRPGARADAG